MVRLDSLGNTRVTTVACPAVSAQLVARSPLAQGCDGRPIPVLRPHGMAPRMPHFTKHTKAIAPNRGAGRNPERGHGYPHGMADPPGFTSPGRRRSKTVGPLGCETYLIICNPKWRRSPWSARLCGWTPRSVSGRGPLASLEGQRRRSHAKEISSHPA
jgi:hypothetical protein